MEKDDKGSTMIRMGVSGYLLVPAYPGCPGSKAVKRSFLLLTFGKVMGKSSVSCFFDSQSRTLRSCSIQSHFDTKTVYIQH